MYKVIVAGSRGFSDYRMLSVKLDSLLKNQTEIEIVSGGARGADKLGERYAKERGFACRIFPADWKNLGNKAGFVRNEEMARYGNACVVFWDGTSRGTANMIRLSQKYGLSLRVVRFGPLATTERVHILNMHGPIEGSYFKIDRTTPLGNPYPVSMGRQECIAKYRRWIYVQLKRYPSGEPALYFEELRKHLIEAGSIRLACWCKPLPCHGDVIRDLLLQNVTYKTPFAFKTIHLDEEITPFPYEYNLFSEQRPRKDAIRFYAWFEGSTRARSFYSDSKILHGNSFIEEEDFTIDHENPELALFDHSAFGESYEAMALHYSGMSQLERLTFESCQLSEDKTVVMAPHDNKQKTPKHFFPPYIQSRLKKQECTFQTACDLIHTWETIEATAPMVETFITWVKKRGIEAGLKYFGSLAVTLANEATPPWDAMERPMDNLFEDMAPEFGTPRYVEDENDPEIYDVLDYDHSEEFIPNEFSYHKIGVYEEPDFMEEAPGWIKGFLDTINKTSDYNEILKIGKSAYDKKLGAYAPTFWDAYNRRKESLTPKIEPAALETIQIIKNTDTSQIRILGKTLYNEQKQSNLNPVSWSAIWEAFKEIKKNPQAAHLANPF